MPTVNTDSDHLDRLRDYYATSRRIPPYQRVCTLLGFASKSAAQKLLERLGVAGFVERTPDDDAWMPTDRFFELTVAGRGTEAAIEARLALDRYLVHRPSLTVLVHVLDGSMAGAGILQGDLVVVERRKDAAAGNIVVVATDNALVIGELSIGQSGPALKRHDEAYQDIPLTGLADVYGVVTGLVRRWS